MKRCHFRKESHCFTCVTDWLANCSFCYLHVWQLTNGCACNWPLLALSASQILNILLLATWGECLLISILGSHFLWEHPGRGGGTQTYRNMWTKVFLVTFFGCLAVGNWNAQISSLESDRVILKNSWKCLSENHKKYQHPLSFVQSLVRFIQTGEIFFKGLFPKN